jgi:ChrR Cupin-like domain
VGQHLSFTYAGKATAGEGQDQNRTGESLPSWIVGGLRKHGYGGNVTPPRHRKSSIGNPPPTVRAPEFYLDRHPPVDHHTKGANMHINLTGVSSTHWQSVPAREIYPGVRKRDLWRGQNGAKALVLEIDAGASFTELDVHEPGPEEVFVVSGTFSDGVHEYPAGSFIHNPTGSAHVPQSKEGCVLFVFFPEG